MWWLIASTYTQVCRSAYISLMPSYNTGSENRYNWSHFCIRSWYFFSLELAFCFEGCFFCREGNVFLCVQLCRLCDYRNEDEKEEKLGFWWSASKVDRHSHHPFILQNVYNTTARKKETSRSMLKPAVRHAQTNSKASFDLCHHDLKLINSSEKRRLSCICLLFWSGVID